MNTIEKKVKSALLATFITYRWYECWIKKYKNISSGFAQRCRTLAVVKHDRLLNGR